MADGSGLPFEENLAFTQRMVRFAASMGKTVEAELGRLSGDEDGIIVEKREARLTDPSPPVRSRRASFGSEGKAT
jgi:tagatose 1,6-diphosphate aldolase GatY/KbaY